MPDGSGSYHSSINYPIMFNNLFGVVSIGIVDPGNGYFRSNVAYMPLWMRNADYPGKSYLRTYTENGEPSSYYVAFGN